MAELYLNRDYLNKNEGIRTFFCSAHSREHMHYHEFWELTYVYEGWGNNHTPLKTDSVKSGEFLLIKPGAIHSLVAPSRKDGPELRLCNCLFTPEFFKSVFEKYSHVPEIEKYSFCDLLKTDRSFCLHLKDDNNSNIHNLVWLMAHEYNHFTIGSTFIIEHSMTDLFVCMSRLYEDQILRKITPALRNPVINELKHYIETNFGYQITLEDLAMQVHLSREYISRYFRQHTGKTISQYLLEVRTKRAMEMLRTTSYPVSDIAEYCGYASTGSFQVAFKKITGMSPNTYRKRNTSSM